MYVDNNSCKNTTLFKANKYIHIYWCIYLLFSSHYIAHKFTFLCFLLPSSFCTSLAIWIYLRSFFFVEFVYISKIKHFFEVFFFLFLHLRYLKDMHFFPFFTFTSSFFLYTSKMNTKLCLYFKYLLRSIYLKYLYLFPFFFLIWFHSEINTRYSKNRKIEKKWHTIYVENPKSGKKPRVCIGHQISL